MRVTVLLTIAVAVAAPFGQSFAGPPPLAEVADKVGAGWSALRAAMPSIQADTTLESKDASHGGDATYVEKSTWRTRGDECWLGSREVIKDARGSSARTFVQAGNPLYEFRITAKLGENLWRLDSVPKRRGGASTGDGGGPKDVSRVRDGQRLWGHYLTPDGQPLAELFRDARFDCRSVAASPENPGCVRVEGSRPSGTYDDTKYLALSGWYDFDPAHGWCLRSDDVKLIFPSSDLKQILPAMVARERQTRETMPGPGNSWLMSGSRSQSTTITNTGLAQGDVVGVRKYTYRFNVDVPASDFTLSAYGLPEPTYAPAPQRSSLPLTLTMAAAALFALSFAFRRYARRSEA